MSQPLYFIRCRISRGGFVSERKFAIRDCEKQEITGISDVDYLSDLQWNRLSDGEPPEGESIDGYVACRVIRNVSKDDVMVELPSSDLARVAECAIIKNRDCVTA